MWRPAADARPRFEAVAHPSYGSPIAWNTHISLRMRDLRMFSAASSPASVPQRGDVLTRERAAGDHFMEAQALVALIRAAAPGVAAAQLSQRAVVLAALDGVKQDGR
jgi:hypothetical protein